MKSIKLVLTGIAIGMLAIWAATKKYTHHCTMHTIIQQPNLRRQKARDEKELILPVAIPVNIPY